MMSMSSKSSQGVIGVQRSKAACDEATVHPQMFGSVTEAELRKVSVADTEVRKALCSYLYAEQTSGLQRPEVP